MIVSLNCSRVSGSNCKMPQLLRPQSKEARSLGHHHLHEFLVVDLPIAINISLTDHLVDFLIGELLTQVGHNVTQFSRTDEAIAITIKNLEGLDQFFLGV